MTFRVLPFLFFASTVVAQSETPLEKNIFQVDHFNDEKFVGFITKVIPNNQFILIGEQHGIKEVGAFTNTIFNLVYEEGFHTVCIETDALAAEKIQEIAGSKTPISSAKELYKEFPLSIPFYNNTSDYDLFTNVVSKGGHLWGIDQTFMAQFRLNFDLISKQTPNPDLKKMTSNLKTRANQAFEKAFESKSFGEMFIYKYSDQLHDSLMATQPNQMEATILNQLRKTKEIYGYFASKQYYQNNNVRGQLMKSNFNAYYKEAQKTAAAPKVILKLGATHATRGLSMTKIYDVSNYLSELAIYNDMRSLHFMVAGIHGTVLEGNPFVDNPVREFDNTKQLPKELQELSARFDKKYAIVHLEPLRKHAYGKIFSEELKQFIFNYDVLVLVKNAEALEAF